MSKLRDGVLQGKATASECHLAINVNLFAVAYRVDVDASVVFVLAARRWILKESERKENSTKN